ncbi:MAG: NADH-quinone oxidoreductase subunit J [Fimbriimonas ginsengisoli]|uniref:NADH-quinone oxidoreductase subunit J n=1 Tax=Fimbriimonas ginsengisoli TaxID=1005039 RepID=A0A931PT22_FIMGI|nr:NADH-quinone oxidoreductase subunit J [Fimbriimonas ginsengisoli]
MEGVAQSPNLLVFAAFAGVAALAAIGVVAFPSALRSALCLVINFFVLAFLYFSLGAELLGITQIVVYTGAIMVLFLFVIMLLKLQAPALLHERQDFKIPLGLAFGAALFALIGAQVLGPLQGVFQMRADPGYGAPEPVGRALFSLYLWPFELASVLLLIGIVGSILLAKRKL